MELTPSPARVREARFTSGLHSQVSRRRRKSGLPVSRDDPSRPLRPYTPWYTSSQAGALRAGDSPARARKRGAHGRAAGPGTVPLAAPFRDLLPALLVQDQGARAPSESHLVLSPSARRNGG